MSRELVFDYSKTAGFIREEEIVNMKKAVLGAKEVLTEKTGAGNDFLGWIDLPVDYDKDEFDRIKKAAEKIKGDSDVLLVIGIGGSYRRLNFYPTAFIMCCPREKERLRRSIL